MKLLNTPPPPPFAFDEAYRRYLDGLLTNNRQQCRVCFEQWLEATTELRTLYDDLVRRSLYEVGDLWERGRISVATEHLATAISEGLLNLTYPRLFARPRLGKSAVVTCVANEYHQIGGKMVADVLELCGWDTYFLGANVPDEGLMTMLQDKKPHLLCLSLSLSTNIGHLDQTIRHVRGQWAKLPIFVGGKAFDALPANVLDAYTHVKLVNSFPDLKAQLLHFGDHRGQ